MEVVWSIMLFCLVTSITPGPNNIMLMSSGLNHGVRKSLPHLFGIMTGFPLMLACIGLGLGVVFLTYPLVHQGIKVVGSTYLLYLAWKIANAGNPEASDKLRQPLTFVQAVAFQWVNPKAWVMAVGSIATFTTVGSVRSELLIIILGYLSIGGLCMACWLLLGRAMQKLVQGQQQVQYFNICMAVLLALSVISMVFVQVNQG